MTCPFCGADVIVSLDGVPESYECGSDDLRQSKICRELCQLREKNTRLAKSLELSLQIILNDALSPAFHGTDHEEVRRRWIKEIREESGIDEGAEKS